MPVYLFKCYECNEHQNVYFGFHDKHEVTCECGRPMSKVIGATPAIFKASGFYKTGG